MGDSGLALFTPQPFARRYLLLDKIATGGMAEVFKAKSYGVEGFEKLVVIKRILPHLSRNARFVSMFINEAKIAVSLNHGNIAQVFHLGKFAEDYFIAMEYVHGRDLMQVLKTCRREGQQIPIPLVLYAVAEVARGLDYAHRKHDPAGNTLGIVHRDISPHNLVLSFEGDVKIVDFGIARIASQMAAEGQKGRLGGKFAYMSPEQARGETMDPRSDLFSLGLVCYELLSGRKAYQGKSLGEKLERVRKAEFVPIRSLRSEISVGVETLMARLLAIRPDDRYQSAGDLYEDLAELMFSHGGMVTAQGLGAFLQELYAEEIQREHERSGLKAVVGSLERLEKRLSDGDLPLPFDPDGVSATGGGAPANFDPNQTLTAGEFATTAWRDGRVEHVTVLKAELSKSGALVEEIGAVAFADLLIELLPRLQRVAEVHQGWLESFEHGQLTLVWGLEGELMGEGSRSALVCAVALTEQVRLFALEREMNLDLVAALHSGPALVVGGADRPRLLAIGDTFRLPEQLLQTAQPAIFVSDGLRPVTSSTFIFDAEIAVPLAWGERTVQILPLAGLRRARGASLLATIANTAPGRSDVTHERWLPRGDEIEILVSAMSAVDHGQGRIVGITGEPGVGKSFLLKEVGRVVRHQDVGWQHGRCTYRERDVPLAVFRNMLARGTRIHEQDGPKEVLAKIETLLEFGLQPPDIHHLSALFARREAEGTPVEGETEAEEAMFRAMRRLVSGMSKDRPLVFAFENIQWMDPLSTRLLTELLELTSTLRVLVLASYSATFQPSFAARVEFSQVSLEPLKAEHVAELIPGLLGTERVPETIVGELHRRSRGNPRYLEQMISLLLDTGGLVVTNGVLTNASIDGSVEVPETLQGLIEARVAGLRGAAREVLMLLAVAGRKSSRAMLQIAWKHPTSYTSALKELTRRQLLQVQGEHFRFRDHMTWNVVYHSVPSRDLKAYHLRIGQAFEAMYQGDLARHAEALFHHFEVGGSVIRAAHYASMAGDLYHSEDFTSKAVDFYQKALDLLRSSSGEELGEERLMGELAILCLKAGRLQFVMGERSEAERTLERGLDYAGDVEDTELEIRLMHELGLLCADKGDRFLAQSYLEHALELSEALGAVELTCEVLDTLGGFYLEGGELDAAEGVFDKGLALADRVQRPIALAQVLIGKGAHLFHLGDYEGALERFRHALLLSQDVRGHRILSGRILNNIGNTYNFMGRFDEAMEAYRRSGEINKAVGSMRGAITNLHNLGDLFFRRDRLAKAYGYFQESCNLAREYRWGRGEASNLVYMGYIEAVKGAREAGLKTIRQGSTLAREAGHPEIEATGLWLEGRVLAKEMPLQARDVIERALTTAQSCGQRKLEEEIIITLGNLT